MREFHHFDLNFNVNVGRFKINENHTIFREFPKILYEFDKFLAAARRHVQRRHRQERSIYSIVQEEYYICDCSRRVYIVAASEDLNAAPYMLMGMI